MIPFKTKTFISMCIMGLIAHTVFAAMPECSSNLRDKVKLNDCYYAPGELFGDTLNNSAKNVHSIKLQNVTFLSDIFYNLNFTKPDFTNVNFDKLQAKNVTFQGGTMHNTKFDNTIFAGNGSIANSDRFLQTERSNFFNNMRIINSSFSHSNLTATEFTDTDFNNVTFSDAKIVGSRFKNITAKRLDLSNAKLHSVWILSGKQFSSLITNNNTEIESSMLVDINLANVKLASGMQLNDVNWHGDMNVLNNTNLTGIVVAQSFLWFIVQGNATFDKIDMRRTHLTLCDKTEKNKACSYEEKIAPTRKVSFGGIKAMDSRFKLRANVKYDFNNAEFKGVNFSGSKLVNVNFKSTIFKDYYSVKVDFSKTDLTGSMFNLTMAEFNKVAKFNKDTNFSNVEFKDKKCLKDSIGVCKVAKESLKLYF